MQVEGRASVLARFRDRRTGKAKEVEIPLGRGITRDIVERMGQGNMFKITSLAPRFRPLLSDVYHEPRDGARDGSKHLQNAMSELELWQNDHELPMGELERLAMVARAGHKVHLKECTSFDERQGACDHGSMCRYVHDGETRSDARDNAEEDQGSWSWGR